VRAETLSRAGRNGGGRAAPALERATWRPPWYAWALLGAAALVLTPKVAPERLLHGYWLILTPCLVVACVLAVRRLWELPPVTTMCAAIVLTTFSGAWRQMGLGGLPFDRLLVVIVLLAVFLRAPGVAHTPRLRLRSIHLLMCLTIAYVLASALAAGTLTGELSILSLIDQVGIVPYLMFLVAPAIFSGQRERNLLLMTLVGLGLYLGFTAIFESFGPHSLVFPSYIARFDARTAGGRVYGPFQGSVAEGFSTFACAVAAVIAFTQWRGQRRRYAAAVAATVCLAGCFLTLERGVWIAAAVATVVTALATRAGRRWLVPGVLVCALAIGGALSLSSTLASKASGRVNDEQSVWDRQNQTSAALRMIPAKPLLGFGWDRFESDSLPYFRQAYGYPMTGYSTTQDQLPLHDTYLSYAVELGLVGALLWLATLLWGMGMAIFSPGPSELRPWKLGLLAIAVFSLVVSLFNPYSAPFPTFLLWLWAGVALGCTSEQARRWRTKSAAGAGSRVALSST
jgi:putative inorganic carbon (HCO3(-)) transporter